MSFEISRRPDNDQARRGTYARRDHVLIQIVAPSDPCIEAIANKIREAGFNADIDSDLRIVEEELG